MADGEAGGVIALVLGGAACVWDDLRTAEALIGERPRIVIATNDAGVHYDGHLDHWVTLHAMKMEGWEAERAALGKPKTYTTWGRFYQYGEEHLEAMCERAVQHGMGTSGILAVEVAVELGAAPVILCGCPLDDSAHFFDADPWAHWRGFREHWKNREGWLREHRVRSCSGWTAELLGRPDADWLNL